MYLFNLIAATLGYLTYSGATYVSTYSAFVCSDLGVLTNSLRQEQAPPLSPLQHSSKLDWIAMKHTELMATNGNCTHWITGQEKSPEIRLVSDSPFAIVNCQSRESVCMVKRMLGCDIFYRLRTSPSNLENLLSNSTHMGCFAQRSGDLVYVTVVYGYSISESGRPYDGLLSNTTDIFDSTNPDLLTRPNSLMKCVSNAELPVSKWCRHSKNETPIISNELIPPSTASLP